jgi:hypothetical protein
LLAYWFVVGELNSALPISDDLQQARAGIS